MEQPGGTEAEAQAALDAGREQRTPVDPAIFCHPARLSNPGTTSYYRSVYPVTA